MKTVAIKITVLLFVLLSTSMAFCGSSVKEGAQKQKQEQELTQIQKPVVFGDPFVMFYHGTYYAYGTTSPNGIAVYTSNNLKKWKREDKLALHKDDAWTDKHFWAPEVYYIKEKDEFFMYFSAGSRICVATSKSPLGPFIQNEKEPMFDGEKNIDNTLFIDDDGTPYMYFDRFNDGLNIWVVELEDDLKTMKHSTLKKCINVSQEWERVWPRVNEGPFILKHKDLYYMTYSANSYESQNYGIGCAIAESPEGPWIKYDSNPIFQFPSFEGGKLYGVGHNAFFTDAKGDLWTSFHAHRDGENIHPRAMYVTRAYFTNDKVPRLVISEKDIIKAVAVSD